MEDDRRNLPGRVIGKVIKSDGAAEQAAARPRPGVLNAEEFEARQAAKGIIDEAQKQREEILAEAQKQRVEIFEKAKQEARAEMAAHAATELAKAKLQAGQLLAASEREMVELACRIAEKIIGRDLQRDPDTILEIAANAIDSARTAKAMVLRVNPRDGVALREKRPKLMELIGRSVDISVKDDADVEVGGCIVQTEFGTIDAQLRTQFEMLKLALLPDTGKKEGPK